MKNIQHTHAQHARTYTHRHTHTPHSSLSQTLVSQRFMVLDRLHMKKLTNSVAKCSNSVSVNTHTTIASNGWIWSNWHSQLSIRYQIINSSFSLFSSHRPSIAQFVAKFAPHSISWNYTGNLNMNSSHITYENHFSWNRSQEKQSEKKNSQ